MNAISFKAVLIDNTKIMILNEKGEYIDRQVSFVKRNPYSKLDYNTLVDLGQLWGNVKPNYVVSMLNHSDIIVDNEKRDVYFLTEQEKNYRKILPEKVLGVIEITKYKDFSKINFIQTAPDKAFSQKQRTKKGIGWAMLTMSEKIYGKNKIVLNAVRKAVEFYKKYGFVITYNQCTNPRMVLNRNVKK